MVPARAAPVALGSTLNCTVPPPDPLAPPVTVIHEALLTAVHRQPVPAVTLTEPVPPPTGIDCAEDPIENVQPSAWLTVTILPATVAEPLRTGPVFGWMSSCTVPLPDPLAPFEIPIHGALLAAVHEQSAGVATPTLWDPPAAGAGTVSGVTTALQPVSWLTVNVWPAVVMRPLRAVPEFAATENCTVPEPAPLAPDVMLIHMTFAVAVHPHEPLAVTPNEPDPPAAGTVAFGGATEYVHPLA